MTGSELAQDSQMVTCSTKQQIALTLLLYLLDCKTNLSFMRFVNQVGKEEKILNANIIWKIFSWRERSAVIFQVQTAARTILYHFSHRLSW